MKIPLIFAILIMEQLPKPFTEIQSRDLGCVAVIAIIAEEQRRNALGSNDYPDVREAEPRWAGIVSDRVSLESGQSAEVIKSAIWGAVKAEQERVRAVANPKAVAVDRMATCLALMQADLEMELAR